MQILHVLHFLHCVIPGDSNKNTETSTNRADDRPINCTSVDNGSCVKTK